jgi:hypothetical protein
MATAVHFVPSSGDAHNEPVPEVLSVSLEVIPGFEGIRLELP